MIIQLCYTLLSRVKRVFYFDSFDVIQSWKYESKIEWFFPDRQASVGIPAVLARVCTVFILASIRE